jgi:NTP pyrophosphatase (non-canonical NTP hydrolase)
MMEFNEYQERAKETDFIPAEGENAVIVPLLGLAGEVGSLLVEYKKQMRDGVAHRDYQHHVAEELGDLLWYAATIATRHDLDLDAIAAFNLKKTAERWKRSNPEQRELFPLLFDDGYPEGEQLPRQIEIDVTTSSGGTVICTANNKQLGDDLTDHSYSDDGYRFHDVFHFSYAAVLGWSPITRTLLDCKRRSNPVVKEVEDGARAKSLEEALTAIIYDYASRHNYLEGVNTIDFSLLKTIKSLTAQREIRTCSPANWESAILQGYDAFRTVWRDGGGRLILDLKHRKISVM